MEHAIEPYLNGVALGLLITIAIAGIYLVIFIHDIPYKIAKKRNHPNQDAFHIAGWVSLFLMHAIWPFLWIWAYWYKPEDNPHLSPKKENEPDENEKIIAALNEEIDGLKNEILELSQPKNKSN